MSETRSNPFKAKLVHYKAVTERREELSIGLINGGRIGMMG